jgi:protoheme ferro-lyase
VHLRTLVTNHQSPSSDTAGRVRGTQVISSLRAPKSSEGYRAIGGGSPLRRITLEQADALQEALGARGQPASVYVAMRYWKPFTEDAVAQVQGLMTMRSWLQLPHSFARDVLTCLLWLVHGCLPNIRALS